MLMNACFLTASWLAPIRSNSDELAREIIEKHGEMPPATVNQFQKARLKAFANEHNIAQISVTGGKLIVEPITISKKQASALRKKAGRYLADKKKLIVPMRVVGESEDGTTLTAVQEFSRPLSAQTIRDGA